jgi:transcriptional regulator with XRE-family HTH domain
MEKPKINLATEVGGEMKKKHVTQVELGRRSGVRLATISDFINGKQDIRTHNVERILSALNAKIIFLKNKIK